MFSLKHSSFNQPKKSRAQKSQICNQPNKNSQTYKEIFQKLTFEKYFKIATHSKLLIIRRRIYCNQVQYLNSIKLITKVKFTVLTKFKNNFSANHMDKGN